MLCHKTELHMHLHVAPIKALSSVTIWGNLGCERYRIRTIHKINYGNVSRFFLGFFRIDQNLRGDSLFVHFLKNDVIDVTPFYL